MTERNQSKLQFSIEESVWLNKGQEVDELYNLALDPDVTIEEMDDQICIRGYLCLTGEYRCKDEESKEDQQSVNPLSYRSFSQLEDTTEETVNLDHRFPVDITLPKNRVRNANDLYVGVDHFDYDIPTPSCIEVSASICITGVYEKQADEPQYEPEQTYEQQAYQTHQQDEVYEQEEETQSDDFSEEASNPFPILEFESRRSPQKYDHDEMEAAEYQAPRTQPQVGFSSRKDHDDNQQEYSLNYMRGSSYQGASHPEEVEAEEYASNEEYDYREEYEDEYEEEYSYEEEAEYDYEYEEEYEAEEAPAANKPPREENALYLTKMVTRDEEVLTKMKMCITQAGDSLDSIAGRYDVPASHLMRVNQLESEEIEEGQILYIPVSAHR